MPNASTLPAHPHDLLSHAYMSGCPSKRRWEEQIIGEEVRGPKERRRRRMLSGKPSDESLVGDFETKLSTNDPMEMEERVPNSTSIVLLLRKFLGIQQRRAEAYSRMKRGFSEYMTSGGEVSYRQLCSEIAIEFNDCSKQVRELESLFRGPDYCRVDLAQLLRAVQDQEKKKLQLTADIQLLKKAGRPSERLVSHDNCKFTKPREHECLHVREITEADGTEEAEADAKYDNALKEAIRGVQDVVTTINEHIEEVRYEIAALEAE